MKTRVYRFGLLAPSQNNDLVRTQMRLAHKYRNRLVEIERAKRAEIRALLSSHGDLNLYEHNAKAAAEAVSALLTRIKAAKSGTRTRIVPAPDKDELLAARAHVHATKSILMAARRALREDTGIKQARKQIETKYLDLHKAARATCGVYWGTYLLIEAAHDLVCKMPLYDGTEPNDPDFVPWEGQGAVGVSISHGSLATNLNGTTLLRVLDGDLPKGANPQSRRSAKRQYKTLSMRVDSDSKRAPVWANWQMIMHRPFPKGALVKRASVHVRKIGPREEWYATFTVQFDDVQVSPAPKGSRIALDVGWRKEEDGSLRVATGTDGVQVRLGSHVLGQFQKAEDLQAIRAKNLTAATQALGQFVASVKASQRPETETSYSYSAEASQCLETATMPSFSNLGATLTWDGIPASVVQWRSPARLTRLVRQWAVNRFEGDDAAYEALEAWRYHDHHLWEWETSQRTKALRHRREIYRVFAADLARKYETLVLEDFDLSELAKKPTAENQEGDIEAARSNRQRASVSELRQCLVSVFEGRMVVGQGEGGGQVVGQGVERVQAAYTTRTCAECGSLESWNQVADLRHTCSKCGVNWDQDENAAKNILVGLHVDAGVVEEVKGSKWARVKKEKAARVASSNGISAP